MKNKPGITLVILTLFYSSIATAQTRFESLNYLYSITGEYILSGQHNDQKPFHNSPTGASYWTDEVEKVTGKYPALYGGDLLFHGQSSMRWEMTNEAEKQWNKGAVISIMWHACPPNQSEPCDWEGGVLSSLDTAEWADLLADGGTLNTIWKERIDNIAAPYLQYLEDKGVEVLWRPFHEQNQTLFWWNSAGAENTKALWKLTHDYMTNDLGLSNLIWTWNVQDIHSSYQQYNPGDEYFDMACLDVYGSGFVDLQYYNALVEQAGEKPVAFGECFKIPTASIMKNQPNMSFFMIWAYGLYEDYNGKATNTTAQIIHTYENSKVITLDEMPKWSTSVSVENEVTGGIASSQFSKIYPNPLNNSATISYQLARNCEVELKLYDSLGKKVMTMVDQEQEAGNHYISLEGEEMASGVYFVCLVAGMQVSQRRIVLVR